MKQEQIENRIVSAFVTGLLFFIIGLIAAYYKVDIIYVKPLLITGAALISGATIASALFPRK